MVWCDPQVKTCGYPRLAPSGPDRKLLILAPMGVGGQGLGAGQETNDRRAARHCLLPFADSSLRPAWRRKQAVLKIKPQAQEEEVFEIPSRSLNVNEKKAA
jgi:hypothetical protein